MAYVFSKTETTYDHQRGDGLLPRSAIVQPGYSRSNATALPFRRVLVVQDDVEEGIVNLQSPVVVNEA